MTETIIEIVAEALVQIMIPLLLGLVGLIGTWLSLRIGKHFGEKNAQIAREAFGAAARRAVAHARAKGLTGEALEEAATGYLRRTMSDHIKKLGANEGQVRERVSAEAAIQAPMPQAQAHFP